MAVKNGFFGTDVLLKNLNKEIKRIEGRSDSGLGAASQFIKGEAQKRTPVKTGNLMGSAYVDRLKYLAWVIGYTASYAPDVHEINKNYTQAQTTRFGIGPQKGWKFLERALKENHEKILQIIASRAKIK